MVNSSFGCVVMEGYYADDGTWFPGASPGAFDLGWYNSSFLTLPYIPEVESQNQTLGTNPHIQTFFEGPKKCDCCPNWIEKLSTELPEVAKERYDQASVKMKDHGVELQSRQFNLLTVSAYQRVPCS